MFSNRAHLGASNATKTEAQYLKAPEQVDLQCRRPMWESGLVPKDVFRDGRVWYRSEVGTYHIWSNRTHLGASNATKIEAKYWKVPEQVDLQCNRPMWESGLVPKDVFRDGQVWYQSKVGAYDMFFNRTQLGASNATKTEAKYLKALEQVDF